MAKVFANGRSVLHAGDGNKHVAAPPDVCKTPSPGGPVPIPYVNVASDGDLAKGTKKVKVEGKSAAKADANLSTSMGDEPGTAGGGILSSKTKGKLTWATSSPNVKLEGKGAVRFLDVTQHNGNSFNSAFTSLGAAGLAYLDDFEGPCQICGKGPDPHRVPATSELAEKCTELLNQLQLRFKAATTTATRAAVARTYDDGETWSGYMVGIMECKCDPPKYWTTNSGMTMPGLEDAAGALGINVVGGGAVNKQEFAQSNQATHAADGSRIRRKTKTDAVKKAFAAANIAKADGKPGYNRAGNCAGAKLVGRCSHAPVSMCEVYFQPAGAGSWSAVYEMLVTDQETVDAGSGSEWQQEILNNRHAKKEDRTFTDEEPVASCKSCQETLFLTNCPERTCG